jgi:3-mercaptopyruvate sulfurtransferase SseA
MSRSYPSIERLGVAVLMMALVGAAPAAQPPKAGTVRPSVGAAWDVPAACSSPERQAAAECDEPWISPAELSSRYREHDVFIVDVRDRMAYWRAHLPGAVSITADSLGTLSGVLCASDVHVVVYGDGTSGDTPLEVVTTLRRLGIASAQALEGGFDGWVADGRVVVTQPSAGLD